MAKTPSLEWTYFPYCLPRIVSLQLQVPNPPFSPVFLDKGLVQPGNMPGVSNVVKYRPFLDSFSGRVADKYHLACCTSTISVDQCQQ